MKRTLGLLKPSALTPKTDGETVTSTQEKLFHLLSTKSKCKLKPRRLLSNFILSEVNLHFSKKEENGINMIDAILRKLCYQRKYLMEDYVPVQNTHTKKTLC